MSVAREARGVGEILPPSRRPQRPPILSWKNVENKLGRLAAGRSPQKWGHPAALHGVAESDTPRRKGHPETGRPFLEPKEVGKRDTLPRGRQNADPLRIGT